jgi:putative transposase
MGFKPRPSGRLYAKYASVRIMLVLEFKLKANSAQQLAIDEAIRTVQFVRNKALRYWIDHKGANKYDLNNQCAV